MGITERKEREKEHRRQAIIDAAEKVFFTNGFFMASMDQVAEAAELSKGTLYLYFKNKQELHHAINLRGMNILKGEFLKVISQECSGAEKCKFIGDAYFKFAIDFPHYFDFMLQSVTNFDDVDMTSHWAEGCHISGNEIISIVSRAIGLGLEDGSIKVELDPFKTALLLWGQSTGVIQIIHKQNKHMKEGFNLESNELVQEFFEFMRRGLGAA